MLRDSNAAVGVRSKWMELRRRHVMQRRLIAGCAVLVILASLLGCTAPISAAAMAEIIPPTTATAPGTFGTRTRTRPVVNIERSTLRGSRNYVNHLSSHPRTSSVEELRKETLVKDDPRLASGMERKMQGSHGGKHKKEGECDKDDPPCEISGSTRDFAIITVCAVVGTVVLCLTVCWCRLRKPCGGFHGGVYKDPYDRGVDPSIVRATFCGTLASVVCASEAYSSTGEEGGNAPPQACTPCPINATMSNKSSNNGGSAGVYSPREDPHCHTMTTRVCADSRGSMNAPLSPAHSFCVAFNARTIHATADDSTGARPFAWAASAGSVEGVLPDEQKEDGGRENDTEEGIDSRTVGSWRRVWSARGGRRAASSKRQGNWFRGRGGNAISGWGRGVSVGGEQEGSTGANGRGAGSTTVHGDLHVSSVSSTGVIDGADVSDVASIFSHKRRRARAAAIERERAKARRRAEGNKAIGGEMTSQDASTASGRSTAEGSVFDTGSSIATHTNVVSDGSTERNGQGGDAAGRGVRIEIPQISSTSLQRPDMDRGVLSPRQRAIDAPSTSKEGQSRLSLSADNVCASCGRETEQSFRGTSADYAVDGGGQEEKREIHKDISAPGAACDCGSGNDAVLATNPADRLPETSGRLEAISPKRGPLPRAKALWRAFSEVDHDQVTENHRLSNLRHLARRTIRHTNPNPELWHFTPEEYPPI